jgi:nitrogen fixation protein FixH
MEYSTFQAPTEDRNEQLAQWLWTMGIVGFFALQAILWMVAITLTLRDPSFAVAQHYEQQAEQWDAVVAERRASDDLGWTIEFSQTAGEPHGWKEVRMHLVDRLGAPINGAIVQLRMFHCARAAEVQQPTVHELGNGWYAIEANINKAGNWKLVGSIRSGVDKFCLERKVWLESGGGPQ